MGRIIAPNVPVKFPAVTFKGALEKLFAIDVTKATQSGHDPLNVALATGGELIRGLVKIIFCAPTWVDVTRINHSTDEGNAPFCVLEATLFGVESELELITQVFFNEVNVAKQLVTLVGGYNSHSDHNIYSRAAK